MSRYQNLVIAGCSFSAGSSSVPEALSNPVTWSHFLLDTIKFDNVSNLSMPGASNISTSQSLICFLEIKKYLNSSNSIIVLQITNLDRYDTICPVDHPYANRYFSLSHELNFKWITEGAFITKRPPFYGELQKNIGLEQVIQINAINIISAISYLENQKHNYCIMFLNNYLTAPDTPQFLKDFLTSRINRIVKYDNCIGMYEYSKENNLLHDDNFHPNNDGYKSISNYVNQHIQLNF